MAQHPSPLAPLLFPLPNLVAAALLPSKKEKERKVGQIAPTLGISGYVGLMATSIRASALAFLILFCSSSDYPGLLDGAAAKEPFYSWLTPILIRNLLGTWVVCGLWDWVLYFSPLKERLSEFKITASYPHLSQFTHDAAYTTLASVLATGLEGLLCYAWASGILSYSNLEEAPIFNLLVAATVSIWRSPHFYIIHRMIHPWRVSGLPDIGRFLYRKVHSLHHKSYNPTAWSGTSMHPVESTLYYSSCLIPVLLGLHPIHAVSAIIDSGLSAWTSHDGFTWPGSGNPFHMLHHSAFDCNYGNAQVPLDYLFGTFAASKSDIADIWRNQK